MSNNNSIATTSVVASTTASTNSVVIDNLKYSINEGTGLACLEGYVGKPVVVTIPETIEVEGKTYHVHQIEKEAFAHCAFLTSVTIPNSVKKIREGAFWNCSSLTSVAIPNSIEEIEDGTFGLTSLTSVTIPNSVKKIGKEAFRCCFDLASITIPSSVEEIGHNAFSDCTSLYYATDSVVIDSLKYSIDEYTGLACLEGFTGKQPVTIVIPETIEVEGKTYRVYRIDDEAFYNCYYLTSITIPDSVKEIGEHAFADCTSIYHPSTTTASANANIKEENTMSNSVASTSIASTDPAIDQLRKNIDAADKNLIVIYQLRKLEVLSNDLIDIAEKYRNETNPELLKEGLDASVCLTKDYIDTFYKLPEEYRDKANKKTEEWWSDALSGNFEDIISSSVKFSRGLYRELLNELMDKQYQLLSC